MFWILNIVFVIVLDIFYYAEPISLFDNKNLKITWPDLFINVVEIMFSGSMLVAMLMTK